jgi:hypothetical protein
MKKICSLLLLVASVAASATVRYAKPAVVGLGNGSSWSNASDNIDSLINISSPGDEIWVAQGVYYPTLDLGGENSFNNHFVLRDGVKLYGGFSGNGTETMVSQRDFLQHETILGGINFEIAENGWAVPVAVNQILVSIGNGTGTIVDGFTVSGGYANDPGNVFYDPDLGLNGAGMYISNSSVQVSNCIFTNAHADSVGGSMYILGSSPTISNCTFKNNDSYFGGGAICNDNSSPVISHCVFKNNLVSVFEYDGEYEVLHGGGGIYNRNHSSPSISYCVFDSNKAGSGSGGAIDNYRSSSPTINNSLFLKNGSGFYGGGMRNEENCTPELVNCTFYQNVSTIAGGGIYNQNNSIIVIRNSVMFGNLNGETESNIQNIGGGNSSVSFSLIKGSGGSGAGWQTSVGIDGGGNIDADPMFVDVSNVDGLDEVLGTADDGLALSLCSPAVNAGNNVNTAATDITGANRIIGGTVDMGAYESMQNASTTVYRDADEDGYGDPAVSIQGCLAGYVANNYDCNDADATIHPNAVDICGNGIDENCSGPVIRLYVNKAAPAGGSGETWDCAIKELRDAVTLANNSPAVTEIFVAKGVYKPTAGTNRNSSININRRGLSIVGGFVGNEQSISQSDPVTNVTTISGDIGVEDNMADNSYHLLRINAVAVNKSLVIKGFQFDKGNANASNNLFDENAYGGAFLIYNNQSTADIIVTNCAFTSNNSNLGGGAVCIYNAPKLNDHTAIQFYSCMFYKNTSAAGGAVESISSGLSFQECVFKENKTFIGNGGAVNLVGGQANFDMCAFDKNGSRREGGAVFQGLTSVNYSNCVFNGNGASIAGGAIAQLGGSQTTRSSTFFANTGSLYGGAIYRDATSNVRLMSNVFWKNAKNKVITGPGSDISSGALAICSYNILQAGTAVSADNGTTILANLRGVNPQFANEAEPAGDDGWLVYESDGLALSPNSPAINTGDPLIADSWDVQHEPRNQCGAPDKGAYEYKSCIGMRTNEGIVMKNPKNVSSSDITATITNPFTNTLNIYYSGTVKASLSITDLSGKPMQQVVSIQPGLTRVNTAIWSSGMYLVAIYTNGKPKIFKVIKLK